MLERSRVVVDAYESSVPDLRRRRTGVHYTPARLAESLTGLALEQLGRIPESVVDPSCGAGSFLLAAADTLVDAGVEPSQVLLRLAGADIDPAAVAACRDALEAWAGEHRLDRRAADAVDLRVADMLAEPPVDWSGRFDLVVGNPPFLGQLSDTTARDASQRAAVRERFIGIGPYVDTAALFVAASLDLLRVGGVSLLIQPASFLAARDTAAVRDCVLRDAQLVAVWASPELHFDAGVHVCAPVLRVGGDRSRAGTVGVRWGSAMESVGDAASPEPEDSWGPLLAAPLGVPSVPEVPVVRHRLHTIAASTAGFRDEFYALADAAREFDEPSAVAASPRLVTVGMIDPSRLTWGHRARKLAGRSVTAPRLDLPALQASSPRVAEWVHRRLRPKVLVASQTRVLEAVADPVGDLVPVTPVISVEPFDSADTWLVLAALLSPTASATAAARRLGTGMSVGAVRWSASAVGDVDLPIDRVAWDRGALLARRLADADGGTRADLLGRLGRTMCIAHGCSPDSEVMTWWYDRVIRC
jgi:SAM-dependent methyltransferase